MQKEEPKKDWSITSGAFHKFLEWLDAGENSDGQTYLEMRRRLVAFFDRKNCLSPDELADETLTRVARRLEEAGKIESETPAKFCYLTARYVFMEYLRGIDRLGISLDSTQNPSLQAKVPTITINEEEEKEVKEKMLACLEGCTMNLDSANREVIVSYYYGVERSKIENRRRLAQKLGISSNALSIRACRIRDKLEICVKECSAKT